MTEKQAQLAKILKALARPAVGAAVGGGLGYHVTPHIFGYADVPEARRLSAINDALSGAVVGGLAGRAGGFGKGLKQLGKLGPKAQLGIAGGVVGVPEIAPIAMAGQRRAQIASQTQADAARSVADAAGSMSIPKAITDAVTSNPARGAAVGAGAAGLAALLTGMLRRKNRTETIAGSNRQEMVRGDFLKYLLPALVAGGVVGSMRRPSTG